jgi:hypothetical protein
MGYTVFARALGAALLLAATACTPSADDVKASRAAKSAAVAARASSASADAEEADMVAAVTEGTSDTPVSVSYRLTARPVLQQPSVVDVAIRPFANAKVLSLHLSIRAGEGLELSGEPRVEIADAGAQPVFHQPVTVLPRQAGVLQLHVTVLADTTTSSMARSYSIPLVVTP